MSQDLERLLQATEGQPPSAEFVARLRSEIVSETERVEVDSGEGATDDGRGVVLDIGFHRAEQDERAARRAGQQRQLRRLIAAAAAALVVAVGVWGLTLGDDDPAADVRTFDAPTATEVAELDTDRAGVPLTTGNTFFGAGTFRIDTLGTAFTFSVEATTGLLVNEDGIVSISDLTTRNVDDRTITLRRTAVLPRPSASTAVPDPASGWPATDLDGWVEALGDEVVASDLAATRLGGRDASFVELELPCPVVECAPADLLARSDLPMFVPGSRYRLWIVDQDQEDPIVVVAAIDDADDVAWFDRADAILASLAFGPVEANPVRRALRGPVELDAFDGVSVQVPDEVIVVEPFEGFARIIPTDIGGELELLTRPLDIDGAEVTAVERLLDLLADEAVEAVEVASVDVDGIAARTFAIDAGPFENVVLSLRDADLVRAEDGWAAPGIGHLWVIEHPQRGLLIASAESFAGPDGGETLRAWTEGLLRTLEFEDV